MKFRTNAVKGRRDMHPGDGTMVSVTIPPGDYRIAAVAEHAASTRPADLYEVEAFAHGGGIGQVVTLVWALPEAEAVEATRALLAEVGHV